MAEELKTCVKEAVWDATGRRSGNIHSQIVQLEVKQDKFEQRILAAEEYRLLIFKTTKPLKLEQSIHYCDITEIQCHDLSKLSVSTEGKQVRLAAQKGETFSNFLRHSLERISIINHSVSLEKKIPKIDATDEIKDEIYDCLAVASSLPHLISPCGNLSNVYHSKCDQMGVECQEDVAWDVDAIYNSQNCFEFNLSDFDHLSPKNMIPLLASLERNDWFTKLNLSNIKLTADLQNELLKMLKENKTFEDVNLSNTGIRSDFLSRLFAAGSFSSVCSVDLSNNNLDDKAIAHLSNLARSPHKGTRSLNLSKTSITSAGVGALARVLSNNQINLTTLTLLDLSGNSLKEEATALQNFLAQPNKLKVLRLADTETPLENFFAASLRGCTQHLEVLDLSGCQLFQSARRGSTVPMTWKQFFSSVSLLRSVNFSNNKFTPEAYKMIFSGLEENTVAADIELNFSSCQIGSSPAIVQVFEQSVGRMSKVSSLDLSDNGFDQSICNIILKLVPNKNLRKLHVGRNLANVKTKFLHQVVESFIALIQEDGSALESLNLDGMKLKGDLTIFIDVLGMNNSLSQLDISGNLIGDSGAKTLSKALLTNRGLKRLSLDNNQLTFQGFEYLANSLEKNMTLTVLPMPLNDLIPAMKVNQDRTEKALRKIESCINRNVSGKYPLNMEPAYKLQQWLFNSFDQETFDSHIHELSLIINEINSSGSQLGDSFRNKLRRCENVLQEAKDVKNVLTKLHELSAETFQRGPLVSDTSRILLEKTKGFGEDLISFMNTNFSESLKSFSQQSRYNPKLRAKEEAELDREVRDSIEVLSTRLLAPVGLAKSVKFAEFVMSSVALSVEVALYNAKSIASRISAGEDLDDDVSLRRSIGEDDKVDDESTRIELKRSSWKNKVRPSSTIASPSSLHHHSKTTSSSSRLSVGVSLESNEINLPVPKPRNKKKKTEAAVRHVDDDYKKGDGSSAKSPRCLDRPVPAVAAFEELPDVDGDLPHFVPYVFKAARKPFLGNLTKSASHDELDEKERVAGKSGRMMRKKSLSRDALEGIVPCPADFLHGLDRKEGAKVKDTITTTVTGVNSLHPSKLSYQEAEPPLDELEVQPTQKLTHLCKDRPKRPKNKVASRPVLDLEGGKEKEEKKEDEDAHIEGGGSGAMGDAGISEEGVVKKELKKGGTADGLLNMFLPKKSGDETPPSLPDTPPAVLEHGTSPPKIANDPGPQSPSTDVKPVEPRMRRTTEGSLPNESSDVKIKGPAPAVPAAAPTAAKRSLPPGAKPGLGLGGFAMPSANEIQQKRLSMRPVSEHLGQTDLEDRRSTVGNNSEVSSDNQSKVKPPPPLAPKPSKNFRDSRRESDTNPIPVLIADDKPALADPSNKSKGEDSSKSASFMEEFRKKQEKNRNSDPPK